MIKNIVSCGCSWMHGSGCHIEHKEKLSALFAKKYNAKDINMAKDGGNNDRSVRKIVDWVVQNKDKLDETIFLLGLSGPERYELWDEERGCYAGGCYDIENRNFPISVGGQESEDSINFLSGRTEKLMGKYHWNTLRDYDRTFRNVIYLMGVLDSLNCKYLIFDCLGWTRPNLPRKEDYYEDFFMFFPINRINAIAWEQHEDYIKLLRYVIDNPLYQEILTHKNFYSKLCWMEFCLPRGKGLLAAEAEQNPDEPTPYPADGNLDWGHPNSKSNKLWFEVLVNYAEENTLW